MSYQFMLSTIDNPFNPFEQFDSWLQFDMEKGYDCCSYLARIAKVSDELTLKETNDEIERAIDEIILLNPLNIFIKVRKDLKDDEDGIVDE